MDYLSLSAALKKHKIYLFRLEDIRTFFPRAKFKTIKNNFSRWLKKGYFTRLKRDLYEFTDRNPDLKLPDLYVANRLYEPSYVSLETALSFYSIIPDIAAAVTSVTPQPTRAFKNQYGSFFYRTSRNKAFTGYRLMLYEGVKVYIADREKALVDFLYYRLRHSGALDFVGERLNKTLLNKFNWRKACRYAGLFNRKTAAAVKKCKEFAGC